jgi:hypothetical protein
MKIENYHLDIKKVFELKKNKRQIIIDMYKDMMFSEKDGVQKMAKSLFNTLRSSGYLVDTREEKIDQIIDV